MASEAYLWILGIFTAATLVLSQAIRARASDQNRHLSWLCGLVWGLFFVFLGTALFELTTISGDVSWSTEFFSLVTGQYSAQIGFRLTALSVAVVGLCGLAQVYTLFASPRIFGSLVAQKTALFWEIQSPVALGLAGLSLAWFSSSLWVAIMGQVLAGVSGWLILSRLSHRAVEKSDLSSHAALAFVRERGLSMALVVVGASTCFLKGSSLNWSELSAASLDLAGLTLIAIGCALQFSIFPSRFISGARPTHGLVTPAAQLLVFNPSRWASFAILYRLAEAKVFFGAEVIPQLVAILALLTALAALAEDEVQEAFGSLTGAAMALAFGVLLVAGARVGATFFLTTQLVWTVFAVWIQPLITGARGRDSWQRPVAALLVLALFGGPGLVSGAALLETLAADGSIVTTAFFLLAWVVATLAAIRILEMSATLADRWMSDQEPPEEGKARGLFLRLPLILCWVFSLSFLWTGHWFDRFVTDSAQQVGFNWSQRLFGTGGGVPAAGAETICWVWMALLLSLVASRFSVRLAGAQFSALSLASEGYRLDRIFVAMGSGLIQALYQIQGFSAKVANHFSEKASSANTRVLFAIRGLDQALHGLLERSVFAVFRVSSKAVQLLQSGSIQVYFLFTVGFTLALLLHFWSRLNP